MDIDYLDAAKFSVYARELGISADELDQLDYEEDTEESEEGLVYCYVLVFSEENPPEIMSKIKGLEGNIFRIGVNSFDEPDA